MNAAVSPVFADSLSSFPTNLVPGRPFLHPTALVDNDVAIGDDTFIWDNVHMRGPSRIGHDCIVGEKSYVAYGVEIGNYVKINAFVYICTAVTIEDRVMVSAGVVFTNDRYPRAFGDGGLAPSGPTDDTLPTRVCEGATIGARAVIGPGVTIGRFAMVGMGAVVVHNVPPHSLIYGSPARVHGWVCGCGYPVLEEPWSGVEIEGNCGKCGRGLRARRRGTETTIYQEALY